MNTLIFELDSIPPSKKNGKKICRNKRTGKTFIASSDRYSEWEANTVLMLKQLKQKEKLDTITKCDLDILFSPKDKIRRDLTNIAEGVMDAMVMAKIILDDNYFVVGSIGLTYFPNAEKPVIVRIYY